MVIGNKNNVTMYYVFYAGDIKDVDKLRPGPGAYKDI